MGIEMTTPPSLTRLPIEKIREYRIKLKFAITHEPLVGHCTIKIRCRLSEVDAKVAAILSKNKMVALEGLNISAVGG